MKTFKALTIWTIVLNFFIVIGAGHGIGCIGLIEMFFIDRAVTHILFAPTSLYDNSLVAVAIFSFVGQILLITSLFFKKPDKKYWFKIAGLIFLWVGFE